MALPLYLALTAAEFQNCSALPKHTAWMACHYSPYGLGLSNIPATLPEGAMLILNDRMPPNGHDPKYIARQTAELANHFQCSGILLDFQRQELTENEAIARAIIDSAPCPVGISDLYARDLPCPVFLPPVPCHMPLEEHFSPWMGREIWQEAALCGEMITVTEEGADISPLPPGTAAGNGHTDSILHCHYQTEVLSDQIRFAMYRTPEDLAKLLECAETLGVTRAIGLWQELKLR